MFYMFIPTILVPNNCSEMAQSYFYIPIETPIIDFSGGNYSMLLQGQRKVSNAVETLAEVKVVDENERKQARRQRERQIKQIDEDYRPTKREANCKKICQQPQNRNIIPNVIRLIVTFIQRPSKSQKILKKLLQRQNRPQYCSSQRYYLYQSMIKNKMHNYVNISSLIQITKLYPSEFELFCQKQQILYLRLTRIMISYFMRREVIVSFLVSKRMEASKRKLHLRVLRDITEGLKQILNA